MNRYVGAAMLAAMLGCATTAGAAVVFDTSLASPPGVYFGSGNVNSHFTVSTDNGVEVGLQAIERYVGPVTPDAGTNVYRVSTGPTSVPGKTGSDWGFVFSINLDASGLVLGGITTTLTMKDVGLGTVGSFDVLLIPDNEGWNGTNETNPATPFPDFGVQNSEALSFLSIATLLGDPNYDMNANDTYEFSLSVFAVPTSLLPSPPVLLASVDIVVVAGTGAAVPEPLTIALLAPVAGVVLLRRRKSATL